MALRERLNTDLKTAMREGDTVRRDTIRLLLSSLRNAEIDARGELDDEAEGRVVTKEIKQRKDSIEEYRKGQRPDLAEREEAEMKVLKDYQAAQLSDEDLRRLVIGAISRTGAKGMGDIGKVMKSAMSEAKGQADGNRVNAIAREILVTANG